MRKYVRLFTLALFTFLLSSMSVSAREMTIEELGEEASKIQSDAGYVYILGEYAFTSNYNISQADIIVASSSLDIENPIDLSQAVIYQIVRQRDDNYQPTGWQAGTNVLGNKALPGTVNVKWIDMHRVLEKSEATISIDVDKEGYNTYQKTLEDKLSFKTSEAYGDGKLKNENNQVSGLLLKNSKITLSKEDQEKYENPEYFFAYILEIPGATSKTTVTIDGISGEESSIDWNNFDVKGEDGKTPGIVILAPITPSKWEQKKIITIKIDLDGDNGEQDEYGVTEYQLDLSGLTFQQDSTVTLNDSEDDISITDKETLENWGYTLFGSNKHYNLEKEENKENAYQLTGKIETQYLKEKTFNTNAEEGYFFVFNLKKPDHLEVVPEGVQVTVKGQQNFTYGKESFNETGVFTEIFKLKDDCTDDDCKITITVDWDGDGKEYLKSQEITIDYSDLTMIKGSKFSIVSVDDGSLSDNPLEDAYGWKQPDGFDVDFNIEETTVKVTGLLPILDQFEGNQHPFGEKDATGYYLPFVIKTSSNKQTTEGKKTTVQFIHDGEESKTLTADNFDGNDVLYILRHLDKDAVDKTFTIIVDMDGEGEEYAPYTLTFDWSDLKLQEKSTANVTNNLNEESEKEFSSWGYDKNKNSNVELKKQENENITKVSGKLVEQKLIAEAFGTDKEAGYYFTFTFEKPDTVKSMDKAKIYRLNSKPADNSTLPGENSSIKKTFSKDDFDSDGSLTILYRFDPTTTKCSNSDADNCKLYYVVDYDGDGYEYLPTLYVIDYSGLNFEKASLFTVKGIEKDNAKTEFGDDSWYDEEKGYSVNVAEDQEKANTYKVTGVLPIFDDENDWELNEEVDGERPFDTSKNLYYLGLLLKLTNINEEVAGEGKIDVKFFHNETADDQFIKITGQDIGTSGELYILKALCEIAQNGEIISDNEKVFTITLDFDGDAEEEYAPYTVTIDWSGLKLQKVSESTLDLNEISNTDKSTFESWSYNSESNKELKLENQKNGTYNLTGTMTEQELSEVPFGKAGKTGYFFYFTFEKPEGVDYTKAKIAQLKNYPSTGAESENIQKEFVTSEYDATTGNLTILFRFKPDVTCEPEGGNCKLYFNVDWDGAEKAYLPTVYTIDYSKVTFKKNSIVDALDLGTISNSGNESWKGWTEDSKYVTEFETKGNTVKVTGFIPIFDDQNWNNENPFGPYAEDYYLAFKLKRADTKGTTANTTVKILADGEGNGETNKITGTDFGENDEIYVLKYINPLKSGGTSKQFTIEVDFDGEDKNEYEPYTLIIDWSDLHFQYGSYMTEVDSVTTEEAKSKLTQTDQQQLNDWGYKIENVGENITVTEGTDLTIAYELSGKIKEQVINNSAGFKTEKGYYIVLKIYGPSEDVLDLTPYLSENKWTVQLRNEDGTYMNPVKPSSEDYQNGYITVLFKLKEDEDQLKYKIDWDGEGNDYLPYEETIDYTDIEFLSSHTITVNDGTEKEYDDIIVWDGDTITADILPEAPEVDDTYHDFAYWTQEDGTKVEDITVDKDTGDIQLVPHWNLYSDKFIADVLADLASSDKTYSQDFSSEFKIENYEKNSGQITITVIDPTTTLSRMNDTSIPGAIAYILLKDEIQSVTLTVDGESKEFTKSDGESQDVLKTAIQNGAKELYASLLTKHFDSKTDEQVTLSNLAQHESMNSFTLTIDESKIADTVTLVKESVEPVRSIRSVEGVPTSYTFTFESDIASVHDQKELETALNGKAKEIYIAEDFSVDKPIDIIRSVNINGGAQKHKVSAGDNVATIFNVKSSLVTIENMTLENASKNAITVESGSLSVKDLTVTPKSDGGDSTFEAAIEVKSGASLTASSLTYESEIYDKPAVKAEKNNAVVNLTNKESKLADKITKEKITSGKLEDTKETDTEYSYYNYYNDANNSKIYETVFYTHEAGYRLSYKRYNHYNEQIKQPESERFQDYTYEGEKYHLIGYSENSWESVIRGDQVTPSSVIEPQNLKATSDKHYWASFKVTEAEGVKKVDNEQAFKDALADGNIKEIYITKAITITYEETLTINRDVSIIGYSGSTSSNQPIIKAQKIIIDSSANKVFINRVNLTIDAQADQDSLIEVKGKKFTLWQSGLSNINETNTVDYAIKYTNDESVVDVRWMGLSSSGFSNEKIKNAYIYVEGKMAAGSEIYFNTFKKLSDEKDSSVIIKGFATDAIITKDDDEPDIRFALNTANTNYAIKLLKETSGQKADVEFDTGTKKIIAVEYDDTYKDFSQIDFYANPDNVESKYIKNGVEKTLQELETDGGQGINITAKVVLPN